MTTVFTAFEQTARAHGAKAFLQVYPEKLELSYSQAHERIADIARVYSSKGYAPGHRVALKLPNCAEFLLHFLALNSLGISVVPMNPDYQRSEFEYVAAHSEAALVVDSIKDFDPPRAPRAGNASECALLYTSGTTGRPKGCVLSNFYFLNVGQRYLDEGGLASLRFGEERLITPLPLFHMNALAVSTTAMILTAGCVVQLDRFHPRTWWRDVVDSRATIVHYLGVMPAILLQLEPSAHDRAHRVRFGYGANANPKDHAAFEARFGFPLIEAWAMTETGGGALVAASREPRHVGTRCIGREPPGLEVLTDENSELLVRQSGPDPRRGFFSGYLKDERATAEAWRDGWFHTGDCVRRGPDGSLHFVDRRKNVIRRAGENIAALEVEATLAGHPAVAQVAVIARPDDLRDEEVMACVVLQSGAAPSRETALSIQDWCLERLAYFKAPGHVAFLAELPVTSTNKVRKAKLADFALNPADSYDLRDRKRRK
ncbi:MAG TPA: AMP-binding protein [Burkholderiales bacterium]|nr:AMP-binding protein [Burkholderiales bacterium]